MKLLRQILGPFLALLLTFGSVAEVSAPVTVAAAGVVLGVGHAQAATPAQKAVVLNGVPGWVLRASGALPSIDMDFAHNRAWVGGSGPRAPPSLLTTTRASTGYAQWSDGHLSSFAANVPRITDLGLLVEQAATNLIIQSQTLDNAAWTPAHSTITANVDTAPDGTLTADKIVTANADANFHQVNATVFTATGGSAYTVTAYLKASGWRYGFINVFYGGASHNYAVSFDLQTGAKSGFYTGNTATPTFAITQAANGFWRVSVTSTDATGGTTTVSIGALNAAGDFSAGGTGDGASGVIAWGAQAELGSFATSYIPTTTVAVTRAADVISLTGAASTAALAAKAAYVQSNLVTGGTLPRLLHYSGGAFMDYASSTTTLISNGTNTATATMGSGTYTGLVHNSYGMGPASITAISNNGTKATSANAWAANTGTVYVGSNNGSNALNGYIPRLALGAAFSQFDGVSQ